MIISSPETTCKTNTSPQNIKFFGIVNGNDCYCSTWFKLTAGAGENCDVKCAGDAGQLCGGQTKASVFAMHDRPVAKVGLILRHARPPGREGCTTARSRR